MKAGKYTMKMLFKLQFYTHPILSYRYVGDSSSYSSFTIGLNLFAMSFSKF